MVLDGRQALDGAGGGDSGVQLQEQHYNGVVVGAANGEAGVTNEPGGQVRCSTEVGRGLGRPHGGGGVALFFSVRQPCHVVILSKRG